MPGRTHSREFTLATVRRVASGEKRPAQLCREHHLDERVLLRWRKEYGAGGEAAFTAREGAEPRGLEQRVAELERFCGQLALENTVLKRRCRARRRGATRDDRCRAGRPSRAVSPAPVRAAGHRSRLVL